MTGRCRELAPGDRVRILKSALDFLSRRRGDYEIDFEVLAILPNDWFKIRHPKSGTWTLWPGRMLRRVS